MRFEYAARNQETPTKLGIGPNVNTLKQKIVQNGRILKKYSYMQ